jgi:hypothetical protein
MRRKGPAFEAPTLAATWAVMLGTAAGIAHLVAVVGLIRGRRWAASLVGYLATAGIAVAGFGALLAVTGMSIFGADRATTFGFFAWMIAWWLIAARYALKPFTFTPQAHRVMAPVAKPRRRGRLRRAARRGACSAGRPTSSGLRHDRTFARLQPDGRPRTIPSMDSVGMVLLAISAFALLEVAAANLRGEERGRRVRRSTRIVR